MNTNATGWPLVQGGLSNQTTADFYSLHAKWGWFLAAGIALMAIGFVAASASLFTTIISMAFLGWLLLIGGVVHSFHAFSIAKWSGFFVTLLTGIVYVVAGLLIIRSPMATALMLTFLIAPLFIVGGIVRAVSAVTLRFPQWGWSAFSGFMGFVLGLLIWNQWPSSGTWLIGTLVGIEMILSGFATLTLAMTLKALPSAARRGEKLAA